MVLALICLASGANAQVTGSVTGVVQDTSGGRIPGATVSLTSESKGTKLPDMVTSANGDYTFVNVPTDKYTLQVSISGFKTVKRTGVSVSPGDHLAVPAMVLEVGGLTDTVDVKGESPQIQATTGDRSYSIATEAVESLPIASRGFQALASLAPGVNGTSRVGGGGTTGYTIDGLNGVDSGNNGILLQVNVESISEVKVLVSNYQAEFGRFSGLQVAAVTKSGTNRFRGGVYGVTRNSTWNLNERNKANILNGDPPSTNITKSTDWGFSVGGPIGKPGGKNKLFFFYALELEPRTQGLNIQRFRMPTALERVGDFSQTTDNNGNPYPFIKDPNLSGSCAGPVTNPANQVACFADGGTLGRIPANRLYPIGLNILNIYPMPNCPGPTCPDWTPTSNFNMEFTRPQEKMTSNQPAYRLDYQPSEKLRGTFRWTGWNQDPKAVIAGSIPGWNDSRQVVWLTYQMSTTVNYNLNASTFLEFSYGRGSDEEAGCALGVTGGAIFCTAGLATNSVANINSAGLGSLPMLFPDAGVLNPQYYAYRGLNQVNDDMGGKLPIWDAKLGKLVMTPSFTYGSRITNAPPSVNFPGYFLDLGLDDYLASVTKVASKHTIKSGFYWQRSHKQQQTGAWRPTYNFGNSTANPIDSTFGYANAALGIFQQVSQASHYVEGNWRYNQIEGYIQDNWKVNRKLTLDYGVRLVHQQPQYDTLLQAANFFSTKWTASAAPQLFTAGCANGVYPCSGTNRQAFNPVTNQFMGPNTTLLIGTLVPNSGNPMNGLQQPGKDIAKTSYNWPTIAAAPRFGFAYDLTGNQKFVLRGGGGLFYDRLNGNTVFGTAGNPPALQNVSVSNGQLQSLGTSGLTSYAPPSLTVFSYENPLPTSFQWNAGIQKALPWNIAVDAEYVGVHNYNQDTTLNINNIDLGTQFLPQYQDPSQTPTLLGSNTVPTDQIRTFRGFGSISQHQLVGWSSNHSLQLSFNRRFNRGLSFGFNDTIVMKSTASTAKRLQHAPDGTLTIRDDQAKADALLGTAVANRQLMKANFVWSLPQMHSTQMALKTVGYVVNGWQLSGIWTGQTGGAYTVGFNYQNGAGSSNLTGSPDYGARILVVGDPGTGCSSDPYKQFTTAAFNGPPVGSVGLDSGASYLRGCFSSVLDLAIQRNIALGHGRTVSFRIDMFNAPNQAGITGRNTTLQLSSPTDPITNVAPVFDPITGLLNDGKNLLSTGAKSTDRSLPKNAGFGVANGYQNPRSVQFQARFSF